MHYNNVFGWRLSTDFNHSNLTRFFFISPINSKLAHLKKHSEKPGVPSTPCAAISMVSEPWASTPPSRCWSRPRRTRPWSCGTSRRLCRPRSRRPSTWSRSIHSEPTLAPSCRWPSHPPVTSAFRGALIAPYGYGICPTPAWTLTIASVSTYLNPIMSGGALCEIKIWAHFYQILVVF